MGIQVLRNDEPVMQASSTQGKSFAQYNSLLLRQEKFEAAEVNWQYVPFATLKALPQMQTQLQRRRKALMKEFTS